VHAYSADGTSELGSDPVKQVGIPTTVVSLGCFNSTISGCKASGGYEFLAKVQLAMTNTNLAVPHVQSAPVECDLMVDGVIVDSAINAVTPIETGVESQSSVVGSSALSLEAAVNVANGSTVSISCDYDPAFNNPIFGGFLADVVNANARIIGTPVSSIN
jgi:hypothetical protein